MSQRNSMSQRNPMFQRNPMSKSSGTERLARWRDRFDRFQAANLTATLTVGDFCRDEEVSVSSFYQWKKQAATPSAGQRKVKTKAATAATDIARFVPLIVQHASVGVRLLLPGGSVMELPGELGTRRLAELITAVIEATDRADASNASHRHTEVA